MRKLFFLFLALVATTSLLAQTFQVGDLYYDITSSSAPYTVEVSGAEGSMTSAIIPSTVTHNGTTYSVTSIRKWAFANCSSLTSVTIPNSVTSIGDYAFSSCSSLTSVTIPNSVESIGYRAFSSCSSLTSVTIPNSVTSIEYGAFYNCSSLTSITCLGPTPPTLGIGVFNGTKLSAVFIPDNTLSAYQTAWGAEYAFVNNETTLTLHVATPGTLADLIFDAGTRPALVAKLTLTGTLNDDDFTCMRETMTSLVDVDLSGITNTSGVNFNGKARLMRIILPTNLTSIGSSAFRDCSSLTSITIPNSVTSIGNVAFYGCSSLVSMVVESGNTKYDSRDNCNAIIETATNILIAGCQNTIIPNSVTSIGDWAFSGCSSLTSITIPNSVTTVGRGMFYGCSKLKSVVLSNNITSLPSYYDGDLTYGFFYGCSSLTSITIPNNVTSIGGGAFYGCSSLVSMVVESGNTKYDSRDNCNAIIETATNILIAGCQNTIIPNSVTSIGHFAFYGCSSLTSVTIGNSVTSIGQQAFSSCSSLTSVTIPNSVTSIGYRAFRHCSSLTSVTIGNSVTSIGEWAFDLCSSLTSITCEATTPPTVGEYAFVSKSIPVYVPCGCVEAYKAANGWKNFTNIQEPLAEYSIEVDVNDNIMGTATVNINSMCGAHISATANIGYHFVQWSDGNTDTPRTLTLTQDTVLTAEFALTIAGQCGDNLYWSYNESDQTISITGSGKMYDYTADTQPWFLFEEQIMEVITSNTATSIGTSAFEGCLRLGKVSLGAAMENVAANAFAGCTRLYHIYCYPTYPPSADESSFANYNVYLHVPCNNKEEYDLDIIWGNFKHIECLSADEVEDTEDVIIESGTTTVIITWPTEDGADTYTIVIKKDGEIFCTLTFNADGQLLNIAFALGRNGNHPVQYAEQAANGYRFTVTGLEEGTDYTYDITVKDASNKTIKSHSGEFTTQSTTAVDNITTNNANIQKIIRDGQFIILRDGVEYNAMGQEM